jgi:NAD(P)-dependent dehydrogenase (short-subunit alcohol dehydrogenase family)
VSAALVTGGASGIGAAMVAALRAQGHDVQSLDLTTGFDVTDPAAWETIGGVELAFLNAGVLTGESDVTALGVQQYRRAVAVNVDGVVLGVRRLAQVMPTGGVIVATASLAGLVAIPDDPVYGLTKHAVVGFVRSVAPQLAERGLRIQALCPAWADTGLVAGPLRDRLLEQGRPLLTPAAVAEAALAVAASEGTGEAWVVQPGREPILFRYPGVPGPR